MDSPIQRTMIQDGCWRRRPVWMAKPYSQDLRDRVIGAVDSGMSARAASRLFGISESTGIKWVARWRRTGSIGAKRMGGYKRSPLDSHVDLIVELITEQSDLTVEEIRSALRERGIRTGHGSVRRFFDRHGISFKKNRARQRTRPSGRGSCAPTMAQGSAGA